MDVITVRLLIQYTDLDNAIGELLEIAGPKANIILFTDLGMSLNYTANIIFKDILQKLEFSRLSAFDKIRRRVQLLILANSRRYLGKGGSGYSRKIRQFYALPNGEQSGAIRINLIGREPNGIVNPGKEYEELCDYLSKAFLSLTTSESGSSVVEKVLRTRDIYSGSYIDQLPDLLIMWRRDKPIRSVFSELIGKIDQPDPNLTTGGHTADGLVLVAGPQITQTQQLPDAKIEDIAPTIAKILGRTLQDRDGEAIV